MLALDLTDKLTLETDVTKHAFQTQSKHFIQFSPHLSF